MYSAAVFLIVATRTSIAVGIKHIRQTIMLLYGHVGGSKCCDEVILIYAIISSLNSDITNVTSILPNLAKISHQYKPV